MDSILSFMCDMVLIYMFFVSFSEKPGLAKTWFSDHLQMLDKP